MDGDGSVFASGLSDHLTSFIQNLPPSPSSSSQALESIWVPDSSPPLRDPSSSTVYFESSSPPPPPARPNLVPSGSSRRLRRPGSGVDWVEEEEILEDFTEDGRVGLGKKRRISPEQVEFLERSFEVENKLEPERKTWLARELGLEPRQVAVWFQNRRARFKTKQLERDFDGLKSSYDKLRLDYESLLQEKEKLQEEVSSLAAKLNRNEKERSNSDHPSSSLRGVTSSTHVDSKQAATAGCNKLREEAASSAKNDMFDSESPCCCVYPAAEEGNYYSSSIEASRIYDPDQSDFTQGEEDFHLTRSLLLPPPSPPLYGYLQQGGSCGFGVYAGVDVENEDLVSPPSGPGCIK